MCTPSGGVTMKLADAKARGPGMVPPKKRWPPSVLHLPAGERDRNLHRRMPPLRLSRLDAQQRGNVGTDCGLGYSGLRLRHPEHHLHRRGAIPALPAAEGRGARGPRARFPPRHLVVHEQFLGKESRGSRPDPRPASRAHPPVPEHRRISPGTRSADVCHERHRRRHPPRHKLHNAVRNHRGRRRRGTVPHPV
jgi:hypothetical protein